MKRKTALILSVIMVITMLFAAAFPASAEGISPRWSNSDECTTAFGVDDNGIAMVAISYTGRAGVFTSAKATVKIEKQFLWFFWNTVDEWTGTCTDLLGDMYYETQVDGRGTYRAVITVEFYGTSGVTDTVEDTIDAIY